MREVANRRPETPFANSSQLAPALLDGMKELPKSSLDITNFDPVSYLTRDINFPTPTIGDHSSTNQGQARSADALTVNDATQPQDASSAQDKSPVVPEQLDTSGKDNLAGHVVLQHLAKVAEHFENYTNKLLSKIAPKSHQDGAHTEDNLHNGNGSNCPFMRVANAVGFKYPQQSQGQSKEVGSSREGSDSEIDPKANA